MRLLRFFAVFSVLAAVLCTCRADTFTNLQTGQILHGYALSTSDGNQTQVFTQENGPTSLNLAHWQISPDRTGRNNSVVVLTLDSPITLELATDAFEQALQNAADQGPIFILLQIDTPGGRVDLAQRFCAAITAVNCPVIAFIKGGQFGGAISAGAAVSLACDKIYMAENTTIGAAAPIVFADGNKPADVKTAFGEEVGEKFSSALRAYFATLAEQNHRPSLLARAMVDKNIEVIEVSESGQRFFIDPVNKRPAQSIVHTWNKKGSLLTLTAAEAVKSTIADKVIGSQQQLLRDLQAENAQLINDPSLQEAEKLFRKVQMRFNTLKNSLDLEYKQIQNPQTRPRALKILREVRQDFQTLIKLAKDYPDLAIDVAILEEQLNSVEAVYRDVKMQTGRQR